MFAHKLITSLEELARAPHTARRLQLYGRSWTEVSPFSFARCAELLPLCSRLREFRIGWLDWIELPSELAALQSLRSVVVLNTTIQGFPCFLSACSRLTTLTLRGTDITHVPGCIRQFQALRDLDLGCNPIISFPRELRSELRLRRFNLRDTPLFREENHYELDRNA
jgi:Leucine-rich repeat (LRR) protein